MQYAPIALFTYNRPDKTKTVIESLLQNAETKDSDLFIFSDGPKNEKAIEGVKANREYIHALADSKLSVGGSFPTEKGGNRGFKSITIIEREKNWGLANSLIAGITELCEKYGRVIVVEDDLILSPYFLKYMNDGLNKYEHEDKVSAISAFLNPVDEDVPNTFFLRYFDCWGWATWKRAWKLFNPDANDLLRKMRWKKKDFDMNNTGGFYGMLYCQNVGLVDSWAVRFYASSFLANKLVLFPGRSYALQNGVDGSGVHCGDGTSIYGDMTLADSPIELYDISFEENVNMYKAFAKFNLRFVNTGQVKQEWDLFKSFVRRLLALDYK